LDVQQIAVVGPERVADVADGGAVGEDELPVGARARKQPSVELGPGEGPAGQGHDPPAALGEFAEIIAPARATEGVISLDIARVLLEPDSFIATAVYEDGAALERQESRPEVHKVVAMLPESLAAPLERTIFDASLDPALV